MFYDKKLIVVDLDQHYDVDGQSSSNLNVRTIESAENLINEFADEFINPDKIKFLLSNKNFVKSLEINGYYNIDKINNISKDVNYLPEFYIKDRFGCFSIDLDKNYNATRMLLDDSILLQVVDKKSIKYFNSSLYESMQMEIKRREEKK